MASEGASGRTELKTGEQQTLMRVMSASLGERPDGPEFIQAGDEKTIPAGYTYLGQFITHDILPSTRPPPGGGPAATRAFDLDSVYGREKPRDLPSLYGLGKDPAKPWRLRLSRAIGGSDASVRDLIRGEDEVASIAEPRNDENIIVAQLHSAFCAFHNKILDDIEKTHGSQATEEALVEAQRLVRWHYQWIVLWDYLPRICGGTADLIALVGKPGEGPPSNPPFKYVGTSGLPSSLILDIFSKAVFRFGHAMSRATYFLNDTLKGPEGTLKDAARPPLCHIPIPIFERDKQPRAQVDLRGRRGITGDWAIKWAYFFAFADAPLKPWGAGAEECDGAPAVPFNGPQASMPLTSRLLYAFRGLPEQRDGGADSLIWRDVIAGQGLPTAQALARGAIEAGAEMSILEPGELQSTSDVQLPAHLLNNTPLLYYILREAELKAGTKHLGPLGRMIVAETMISLLLDDSESYLRKEPIWTPRDGIAGARVGEPYTMAHLLKYAYYEGKKPRPAEPWPAGAPKIR